MTPLHGRFCHLSGILLEYLIGRRSPMYLLSKSYCYWNRFVWKIKQVNKQINKQKTVRQCYSCTFSDHYIMPFVRNARVASDIHVQLRMWGCPHQFASVVRFKGVRNRRRFRVYYISHSIIWRHHDMETVYNCSNNGMWLLYIITI